MISFEDPRYLSPGAPGGLAASGTTAPQPNTANSASCRIRTESDLIDVRALLRRLTQECELSTIDGTKFITACSELARNIIKYAPAGGDMRIEVITVHGRRGLQATFADNGPGIADIPLAMRDGYSSGGSLGIGLPGAKRLVDEFSIDSRPGAGTTVVILKWSRNSVS